MQPNIAAERIARLESYDDIDCIFAHNDVMALAAREAIMRRDSISGRRIRYLGIDATYGVGLEAIVDGRLDASFLYPTGGATAIRKAVELLQGVPVEKNVRLNTATIDRSNAQTLIAQAQQMEDYQRRINRQREELNALSVRFDYLQNSSLAIFCLTALLIPILIYALYANRKIRQKNRELHETNAQIEFQRRELTLKNAQLERASTSKLRFFTNISHEIRTPVSLIINPLQQITRQGNILPAPVYETLKLIIRNADRLLKMVNRILDVSRMEDQSEVLILTEIRIADFLRDVGRCFEPLAQTRKIRFTLQDHSGNAPLTVDADKIELIFMNLLSNAFRFTPTEERSPSAARAIATGSPSRWRTAAAASRRNGCRTSSNGSSRTTAIPAPGSGCTCAARSRSCTTERSRPKTGRKEGRACGSGCNGGRPTWPTGP